MLKDKDKKDYEICSKKNTFNRIFYSAGKWLFVKPLRHLFIDLQTNLESLSEENRKIVGGPCIFVPYHCISVEEPLLGEFLDDVSAKPHGLFTAKVFSRHSKLFGLLEQVPFSTEADASFKKDYQWSLNELGKYLARGESVIIFGDGETEAHEKVQRERKATGILGLEERPNSIIPAKLAFDSGVPVVPLAPYTQKAYEETFYVWRNYRSWFKLIKHMRLPYTLEFLDPLYSKDFRGACEMKREIRKRQLEAYNRQRK